MKRWLIDLLLVIASALIGALGAGFRAEHRFATELTAVKTEIEGLRRDVGTMQQDIRDIRRAQLAVPQPREGG